MTTRRAMHAWHSGFDPGPPPGPVAFRGVRLGLMVGQDWSSPDVAETLAESGADLLMAIDASPFRDGMPGIRIARAVQRVVETGLAMAFCGTVGGLDGVVSDGGSFVLNPDRSLAVQMPFFRSDVTVTAWMRQDEGLICRKQPPAPEPGRVEAIYRCMVLGLADHARKTGCNGVVLGLSGGMESALTAAVAVDAMGAERVRCISFRPEPETPASARLLRVACQAVSMDGVLVAIEAALAPLGRSRLRDTTPARARALLLRVVADEFGDLVVDDGDVSGGYAVLKGCDRATLAELCHWRNAHRPPGALGPDGPVVPDRAISV